MFTATPDFMKIYGITLKHDLHAEGDSILYMNDHEADRHAHERPL